MIEQYLAMTGLCEYQHLPHVTIDSLLKIPALNPMHDAGISLSNNDLLLMHVSMLTLLSNALRQSRASISTSELYKLDHKYPELDSYFSGIYSEDSFFTHTTPTGGRRATIVESVECGRAIFRACKISPFSIIALNCFCVDGEQTNLLTSLVRGSDPVFKLLFANHFPTEEVFHDLYMGCRQRIFLMREPSVSFQVGNESLKIVELQKGFPQ